MKLLNNWIQIKSLFKKSFRSSLHYSIATVDREGNPHVTPIGSLILGEPGQAIYFEEFTRKLPSHCERSNQICVLAVNSSKLFWFKSLLLGQFATPPAIRLYGKLGAKRQATAKEIELWQKRVKIVSFTRGHEMMWENMKIVRELHFERCELVQMGQITKNLHLNLSNENA